MRGSRFLTIWLIITLVMAIAGITIPAYANSMDNTPIYKNGAILWNTSVGQVSLILGEPGSGGWFSFPYLYTCFLNHILVWNFIDGYPKLVYSFYEPGARDVVMYDKYLLVQVKDGINIYEMDTPTAFITYGGIYLPCNGGKLLWGLSDISKDQPVPHIMCPDGKIYGLYKWDFKETKNFQSVDHPIPIPPMVWEKVRGIFGDKLLVSADLPLFIDTATTICETKNHIVIKGGRGIEVIDQTPPYKTVWENNKASEAICGDSSIATFYQATSSKDLWNIIIWSEGITSSITLPNVPTSIYGSYDHFVITTKNKMFLVSTVPPLVLASTTIPSNSTLLPTNTSLYLKKEQKKNTLWLMVNKWKFIPSLPHTAVAYITSLTTLNEDFSLGKEKISKTITYHQTDKTIVIKDGILYTLKGIPINEHVASITIDSKDGSVWWIEDHAVKHCKFSPVFLHIKDYLYSMTGKTQILCLDKVKSEEGKEGYPILIVLGVVLIIIILMKNKGKKKTPIKPRRLTRKYRKANKTKRRKVWRYGSS